MRLSRSEVRWRQASWTKARGEGFNGVTDNENKDNEQQGLLNEHSQHGSVQKWTEMGKTEQLIVQQSLVYGLSLLLSIAGCLSPSMKHAQLSG
jgi:hypothetical protein